MKLYTASWLTMSRTADHHEEMGVQAVGISVSYPRFWHASVMCPRIEMLCPRPELLRYTNRKLSKLTDPEAFARDYLARLDSIGPELILEAINEISENCQHRDLVLACFEHDRHLCHRGLFASWWVGITGELISEWASPIIGQQLVLEVER